MVIWRHCHEEHCEGHTDNPGADKRVAIGTLILVGDAIHNFIDGVLIAAAFLSDVRLGAIQGRLQSPMRLDRPCMPVATRRRGLLRPVWFAASGLFGV